VSLPDISGLSVEAATKKLEEKGFTVEDRFEYSSEPEGAVLGWSQRRGEAPQYSTIYVLRSNGKEDPAVVRDREARLEERRARQEGRERDRARERDRERRERDDRKKSEKPSPPPAEPTEPDVTPPPGEGTPRR
jgi:beta-lactam-binding protein with PASTA domain